MKGRIHSIETFGTVDGPGIRFVLFMQGCALQCQFCHNPDTWDTEGGKQVTVDEIIGELEPYLEYYRRSGGGITVTGGEPTLQASFVAQLFRECKRRYGLHTALDSSGFCEPNHAEELMEATDLVLLDLKQMNKARHETLTGQPNDRIHRFANWLSEHRKPVWIRHVLIPGITDSFEDLYALGSFIGTMRNVQKIELLPYHRMGIYKWQQLNKAYPLEGVPAPSEREVERAWGIVQSGIAASHGKLNLELEDRVELT
ncbi:pyruvate formate-lyase-activating protein [Paenibacillus radicis (ex Xue et al. 2023)]|uniref:Pyruvate formate-lyase-activating enzyme n=1 Tax=Paenibacillus radicis (ex Xue et al. 2023) TaxID=2972489 RepID=A0ABT1YTF5_9BACL|nr:pyruvate formate-lyase-activating protein [Paenibacillus radicis (ex Xue et al. 2023)]MCR8636467.1 pyruvate formate-lyase-activating protein [Paenibacillus radicis (ex Xue et al. 2023)]